MSDGLVEEQTYYGPGANTGLAQGSVVFIGVNGNFDEDNSNFFWDDFNKRLGIGAFSGLQGVLNIKGTGENRDGGWDSSIEIDSNTTNWFPSITFSNVQDGGGGGLAWNVSTSGSVLNNELGDFYLFRDGGYSQFFWSLNSDVGVGGPTLIMVLEAQALHIPGDTTANRPTYYADNFGAIRGNTDVNALEFYASAWAQFSGVLDHGTSVNNVINTTTETSIFSYSVPGNLLVAKKALRLTLFGNYGNNSGMARTVRVRIKFGGTTWYDDTTVAIASAADYYPYHFSILLQWFSSSTNARLGGALLIGSVGATTGRGDLATDETVCNTPISGNVVTTDTSSAQTLSVTIEHSFAASTVEWYQDGALLEVL